MFIVRVHDWDTDDVHNVGPFSDAMAASLWIQSQVKDDNEDIDYEIWSLEAP